MLKSRLQVDIYSFGVVLWEIVTKEMPRRGQLRDVEVPRECPREISDLIDQCLQPNAVARPTAEGIFHYIQAAPRRGWAVDADGNQTGPSTPGNEDVAPHSTRLRAGRDIALPGSSSVVVAGHMVSHVKGGSASSAASGPSRLSVCSGIELASAGGGSSGSTAADSSDDGCNAGAACCSMEPALANCFAEMAAGGSGAGASDPAKAIRPVRTSIGSAGPEPSRTVDDDNSGGASMVTAQDHSGSLQSSRHDSERGPLRRLQAESLPQAPASPTTTVSTSAHSSIETSSSDATRGAGGKISKRFNGITDELLQKMLFREPVAGPARPSAMVLAALADAQTDRGHVGSSWALSPARLNPFDPSPRGSGPSYALPLAMRISDPAVVSRACATISAGRLAGDTGTPQTSDRAQPAAATEQVCGDAPPSAAGRLCSDEAKAGDVAPPAERLALPSRSTRSLRRNSF